MTDKEKLDKLVAEIERRKKMNILNENKYEEDIDLLSFYNSMQEEPAASVWHDANILPSDPNAAIVEHNEYSTSICRAEQMSRVKGAKWAYVEDLLKL